MMFQKSSIKRFYFLFLILISALFTSCVDYVQTVSFKDGKYQLYYKVTLSKVLFAMGDQDPDTLFNDFDEEALSELPSNVEVKPVNTDLEVGAEFTLNIDPRTTDETEKTFLPTIAGKKCFIPFLLGEDNNSISDNFDSSDNSEGEVFAAAMLSSAKCRIMISKKVIPEIETAYFEGKGGQNYSVALFDYGDSWCAEIPFILITENKNTQLKLDKLVVIKK